VEIRVFHHRNITISLTLLFRFFTTQQQQQQQHQCKYARTQWWLRKCSETGSEKD